MVNVVFCISEGNHKRIGDEFSFRSNTQVLRYCDSPALWNRFLAAFLTLNQKDVMAKMQLKYKGETTVIDLENISYIEVKKRIVEVHVSERGEKIYSAYAKLADLEQTLFPLGFIRVSKSYMVSAGHVQMYSGSRLTLKIGTVIPVGECYRRNLLAWFQEKTQVSL